MSNGDLVPARPTPPATVTRSNWMELAKTGESNPLLLVPADCRPPMLRLWMCNAHVLPSALALAATLRVYLDERTLDPDDLPGIVDRLLLPEVRAKQRFASDVLADLALFVSEARTRRAAREATEARRAVPPDVVSPVALGDLFKLPE